MRLGRRPAAETSWSSRHAQTADADSTAHWKASSEVKNGLNDPFGLTLMIPAPLPLPSVSTLTPDFSETQLPESSAPAVNAFKAFGSPDWRIRSARAKSRSGLQAR